MPAYASAGRLGAPVALLVDRDPDTRSMYAESLRLAGWITEEAEDGRDALVKTMAHCPEVIVMDTRLAFIDGYELCHLLRRGGDARHTAIIVLTGDAYPANIERARQAGADAVLTKPCLPEQLCTEIKRLTGADRGEDGRTSLRASAADAPAPIHDAHQDAPEFPRPTRARALQRHETTAPPLLPPELVCPTCDTPLQYRSSHLGGVNQQHTEQWDYYVCPRACGTFQYRQRTRKLRLV